MTAIPSNTAALKFPVKPGPTRLAMTSDGKRGGTLELDATCCLRDHGVTN